MGYTWISYEIQSRLNWLLPYIPLNILQNFEKSPHLTECLDVTSTNT
jgi:hypothetical protein